MWILIKEGWEFDILPQKFRKISYNTLKICVKARFPIFKLPFSLVLCSVCYDFDRDFEGVARYFSEFLW